MPLRKCQEILLQFGLTPTQAKVYLAAVRLGMAPVSRVASASGVRREDTYRSLAKLEEMGLTERVLDKPVQVRALPAEEALAVLTKNWKDSVTKKETTLALKKQEFLEQFEAAKELKTSMEEDHYALLVEKGLVLRKMMEMLKASEKEIDAITAAKEMKNMVVSKEIPQILGDFSEMLQRRGNKSMKIRLILETRETEKVSPVNLGKLFPSNLAVELKYAFKPLSHYMIVDFKNVLLATSREPSMGTVPYLWTNAPEFAQLLQKHFERLWIASSSHQT